MIPGNPHPLLMAGGGDPLDEYGVIARALRFRSSAGGKLNRTFGAAGNQKTWTLHVWAKRAKIQGAGSAIPNSFLLGSGTGVQNYSYCGFGNNWNAGTNNLQMVFVTGNVEVASLKTTRQMRDMAEYVALTFVADTTNATGADRLRLYVEDVRETSFTTAVVPTQNLNLPYINTTTAQGIGELVAAAGYTFEGYMAFFCFVDGAALAPTAFGLRHPVTGQWRPKPRATLKALADAGGANSYFLPFDDPTNTTTLCADASTKGNNWTASNISLTAGATYDSMTDTPTANFCGLNPLAWRNGAVQPTYSDGNLSVQNTSGVAESYTLATMPITQETYFEATILATSANTPIIGVADEQTLANVLTNSFGYMVTGQKQVNGVNSAYGASFTTNDVIGVRVKPSANEIEFYKQTGGSGAFVSQGVITLNAGVTYFPWVNTVSSSKAAFNFGQQPFNNSSPPAAAKLINTKLIPQPTNSAVTKPTSAFVGVTDTGANVQTTLAAARSGWSDYIEIFKLRNGSEGYRIRFSDNLANYLDWSSTAAKAAFPALAGTSYMGYAIKVAAANGVATGRLTHVNGVADTVTDGLGNTRKAIILKNEATGTWYFYHPNLTAGKLLYLEQATAETTDATIGTVLSNSFVVAAALASGTYRWIAFAELDGFLKLGRYTPNNNADGTFANLGLSAAFSFLKRINVGGNGYIFDNVRNPYNVTNLALTVNSTAAETTLAAMDVDSNGLKMRISGQDPNTTGTQIYLSFAAFPLRYANAR